MANADNFTRGLMSGFGFVEGIRDRRAARAREEEAEKRYREELAMRRQNQSANIRYRGNQEARLASADAFDRKMRLEDAAARAERQEIADSRYLEERDYNRNRAEQAQARQLQEQENARRAQFLANKVAQDPSYFETFTPDDQRLVMSLMGGVGSVLGAESKRAKDLNAIIEIFGPGGSAQEPLDPEPQRQDPGALVGSRQSRGLGAITDQPTPLPSNPVATTQRQPPVDSAPLPEVGNAVAQNTVAQSPSPTEAPRRLSKPSAAGFTVSSLLNLKPQGMPKDNEKMVADAADAIATNMQQAQSIDDADPNQVRAAAAVVSRPQKGRNISKGRMNAIGKLYQADIITRDELQYVMQNGEMPPLAKAKVEHVKLKNEDGSDSLFVEGPDGKWVFAAKGKGKGGEKRAKHDGDIWSKTNTKALDQIFEAELGEGRQATRMRKDFGLHLYEHRGQLLEDHGVDIDDMDGQTLQALASRYMAMRYVMPRYEDERIAIFQTPVDEMDINVMNYDTLLEDADNNWGAVLGPLNIFDKKAFDERAARMTIPLPMIEFTPQQLSEYRAFAASRGYDLSQIPDEELVRQMKRAQANKRKGG